MGLLSNLHFWCIRISFSTRNKIFINHKFLLLMQLSYIVEHVRAIRAIKIQSSLCALRMFICPNPCRSNDSAQRYSCRLAFCGHGKRVCGGRGCFFFPLGEAGERVGVEYRVGERGVNFEREKNGERGRGRGGGGEQGCWGEKKGEGRGAGEGWVKRKVQYFGEGYYL